MANRFVSEDPIGLDGGINGYRYAANAPTNMRDPLGLNPDDDDCDDAKSLRETGKLCPIIASAKKLGAYVWEATSRGAEKAYNSGWSFGDLSMTLFTGVWYFAPAKHTAGAANEFVAEHYSGADPRTQNNALHLFGACFLATNYGEAYAIWITTMHETFVLPRNQRREYREGSDSWYDQRNNQIGIEAGANGASCEETAHAHATAGG